MDKLTLQVTKREKAGTGASGRLRKTGHIPAVMYGKGGNRNLSVSESDFRFMMRGAHGSSNPIVEVTDDEGKKHLSVVQQLQRDPVSDRFLHIDFQEVDANQKIHVEVPVHTSGTAKGVAHDGGTLDIVLHSVAVECSPLDMPSEIKIDVSDLGIGDSIHISSLPAIEGLTYLGDADNTVVSVSAPTVEEEEDTEAGEASAEVPTVAETESEDEEGEKED